MERLRDYERTCIAVLDQLRWAASLDMCFSCLTANRFAAWSQALIPRQCCKRTSAVWLL